MLRNGEIGELARVDECGLFHADLLLVRIQRICQLWCLQSPQQKGVDLLELTT